jgi:hypothetical protein
MCGVLPPLASGLQRAPWNSIRQSGLFLSIISRRTLEQKIKTFCFLPSLDSSKKTPHHTPSCAVTRQTTNDWLSRHFMLMMLHYSLRQLLAQMV